MKKKFKCTNDKSGALITSDVTGEKTMTFQVKGDFAVLDLNDLKKLHEMIGHVIRR